MATHSSVLAWRIPGTGEPGGLLSMGSHRVGYNWSDLAAAAAAAGGTAKNYNLQRYTKDAPGMMKILYILILYYEWVQFI